MSLTPDEAAFSEFFSKQIMDRTTKVLKSCDDNDSLTEAYSMMCSVFAWFFCTLAPNWKDEKTVKKFMKYAIELSYLQHKDRQKSRKIRGKKHEMDTE